MDHQPSLRSAMWRRLCCATGLWLLPAVAWAGADAGGLVTIEGGPDNSGHNYEFTVLNNHDSPIAAVSFPHFRADLFMVPQGWSTEGTTNAMGTGNIKLPGVCLATAPSASTGIQPGGQASFTIRVRPKGAWRGTSTVTVTFADGTVAQVPEVPLPCTEPEAAQRTRQTGFVVLGLLFLIVVARRRKKERAARSEAADGGGQPS